MISSKYTAKYTSSKWDNFCFKVVGIYGLTFYKISNIANRDTQYIMYLPSIGSKIIVQYPWRHFLYISVCLYVNIPCSKQMFINHYIVV